jgi:hypothetical protein
LDISIYVLLFEENYSPWKYQFLSVVQLVKDQRMRTTQMRYTRSKYSFFIAIIFGFVFITFLVIACTSPPQKPATADSKIKEKAASKQKLSVPDESQLQMPPNFVTGLSPLRPQPDKSALQPGLSVAYFYDYFARHLDPLTKGNLADREGRRGKTIPYLNHQFGRGEVFDSGTNRGVAMRMNGFIHFPQSGEYIFRALSNDGVRIYVSAHMIIDDPSQHSDRYSIQAVVEINEPGWYPMRVEYFQRKGTATIKLFWQRPFADDFEVVPAEFYAHTPNPPGD